MNALELIEQAPVGVLIPVELAREALAAVRATNTTPSPAEGPSPGLPRTARERLPHLHPDTLLGVHEVAETLGCNVSWVYRRTAPSPASRITPLPCIRREGLLWVTAGALRDYLTDGKGPRQRRAR